MDIKREIELIGRLNLATNRLNGAYYIWARRHRMPENMLTLLYALGDGKPHTQREISRDWLIPKTTVNTVVRECIQAGYLQLLPSGHGKERAVALTQRGRDYARGLLRPIHEAEEEAMARTLEQFSPDFLLAVETLTQQLCQSFRRSILTSDRKEP